VEGGVWLTGGHRWGGVPAVGQVGRGGWCRGEVVGALLSPFFLFSCRDIFLMRCLFELLF
jgi:hypothetical protein